MRSGRINSALVLGGTGAVGRRVVSGLLEMGARVDFTFHQSEEQAGELRSMGARGHQVDFRDVAGARDFARAFAEPEAPELLCVCSGILPLDSANTARAELLSELMAVNVESPLVIAAAVAEAMARKRGGAANGQEHTDAESRGGDIVFLGALAPGQSLPIPAPFAASQGALSSAAAAMAMEFGGRGVRINLIASGLLEEGISKRLGPAPLEAFRRFSALRRPGRPEEIARAVIWLGLYNSYMNGKVIPVNGGL